MKAVLYMYMEVATFPCYYILCHLHVVEELFADNDI
jgi:hypothetical protein